MTTTDQMCLAGHVVSSGATWCCNLPKGHDGPHDDGLGDQWADAEPEEPTVTDEVDAAILRGLIDRRIEVDGPDFDYADPGLVAYARSVRAALERAHRLLPSGGKAETQWMIRDVDLDLDGEETTDERAIRQSWAQGITWWDPDGTYELCRRYVVSAPDCPDEAWWPWEVVERHPVVSDNSEVPNG